MLNRIAVLAASPVAAFLALLLELLLSLCVGKAEAELDASLLIEGTVVLSNDSLSDLSGLESELVSY